MAETFLNNAQLSGLDRNARRAEILRAKNFNALEARVADLEAGGGGGGVTLEQVQDDLGNTSLIAGTSLTKTYNDAANTITLDVDAADFAAASHVHTGVYQPAATVLTNTTAAFTTAQETKLAGIEAGADVTDTANVTAAGALMDSEVDADLKTLSLPANTTISAFGATLVDDADQASARTTLGLASLATKSAIAVPGDITATGSPSSTTYLRGDGSWSTPAGGLTLHWGPRASGLWISNQLIAAASTVSAGTTNRLDLTPFFVTKDLTIDRLAINVTTGVAATNARVLIYSSNADGTPNAKLYETANLSTVTTNSFPEETISGNFTFLADTLYWIGVHNQSTATLRAIPIAGQLSLGLASATATTTGNNLRTTPAFGSAPATYTFSAANIQNSICPMVRMRVV